ncbi:myosin-10-like [Athalia rosae]|uniref:myosin-10-like n=1 Tax=Athalia rosae TaxID=37344 RepID=UPI00203376F9|nr:myosin-10-like [Athalia rosae]XP_048508606.1 myosin-10-like [Athalia rosae]XP_048508608.1 myosin-10-like [Athalia rosae]
MAGECGYHRSEALGGNQSQQVAEAAAATLRKLNVMMKELNERRDQRLELESNVRSLKIALKTAGGDPEEALRPDPLVVHQREEIGRLELARDKLENDVRRLRTALLESDRAITCSGAKSLIEKMAKIRDEAAEERKKLMEEIGYLKIRLQEAEEDSSCSALGRLRKKLRDMLKGDRKMETIISELISRSCNAVQDLTDELKRLKEMLDESRLENNKLEGDCRRLNAALTINGDPPSGLPGYLETIERLRFRIAELERGIEELQNDPGLVRRMGELEEQLEISRTQLTDQETQIRNLSNELLGAKTAYRTQAQELCDAKNGCEAAKSEAFTLKKELEDREHRVKELEVTVAASNSLAKDLENLRNAINGLNRKLLNVEIERDGLLDELENVRGIVSDRNEQIVKILADIETLRSELSHSVAENESLKALCANLKDLEQSNSSKATGDRVPLEPKIIELEKELIDLKKLFDLVKKNIIHGNEELKTSRAEANALKVAKVKLETELTDARRNLTVEQCAKEAALEEAKTCNKENQVLKSEKERLKLDAKELVVGFVEELRKLNTKNAALRKEINRLAKTERVETVRDSDGPRSDGREKMADNFEKELEKLTADYEVSKSEIERVKCERDALKDELKNFSSANIALKGELRESEEKVRKLTSMLEEMNKKLISGLNNYMEIKDKLRSAEKQLEEILGEVDTLKLVKTENTKLKENLEELNEEKSKFLSDLERLRADAEKKNEIRKSSEAEGITTSRNSDKIVMDCGDYVRADKELKYFIHLQSLAVKRVVDFISYVEGTTSLKPSMATFLEPTLTNVMVLNFDENVTTTFRMSQKLSETIFNAETNVQRLETLKNETEYLRAERDCLNKGMEKLTRILRNLEKLKIRGIPELHYLDSGVFNSSETDSWPGIGNKSVIERERFNNEEYFYSGMAELSSGVNSADFLRTSDPGIAGGKNFYGMNRRILELQEQIKAKQQDAAERLIEMRETMRQERIQLMEIAERGNSPHFTKKKP